MAQIKIPMNDAPSFTQTMVLDNDVFKLLFNWNTRGEFWTMSISDANDNGIISGIRLVISYPLLFQHKKTGRPAGEMFVFDDNFNTRHVEPGRHDFTTGDRKLSLLYWSAS